MPVINYSEIPFYTHQVGKKGEEKEGRGRGRGGAGRAGRRRRRRKKEGGEEQAISHIAE